MAAASLIYFDKSVHELTIAEAAYLAALPKAPTQLHPFRQRERAIERRNYVIDRMKDDGYINAADAETAKKTPLVVAQRTSGTHVFAGEYFAEEVRREILEKYGEKKLYEGGLSVRRHARSKAAGDGQKGFYRRRHQVRRNAGLSRTGHRRSKLRETGVRNSPTCAHCPMSPRGGWRLFSTSTNRSGPHWLPAGAGAGRCCRARPQDWQRSARRGEMGQGRVRAGPQQGRDARLAGAGARRRDLRRSAANRRTVPAAPDSGNLRRDGGDGSRTPAAFWRSWAASRSIKASSTARHRHMRQPGSSFKPLVYAAAIDNGYTPASIVMDAPIEIDQGPGMPVWRPENYSTGKYYGPQTLRFGITFSRNIMTVRLAQDIGMPRDRRVCAAVRCLRQSPELSFLTRWAPAKPL